MYSSKYMFPINIEDSGAPIAEDQAFMLTCNSQGHVTKTTWKNKGDNGVRYCKNTLTYKF